MGRLSKMEWKNHEKACELLEGDKPLSWEERRFIAGNWRSSATNNVSKGGSFFTPYEIARLMHSWIPTKGRIVDFCAGIGTLSLAIMDMNENGKNEFVCVEQNADFIEVGRRLVPEAEWIQADAYEKSTWDRILAEIPGGKFSRAMANPPFGKIPTANGDRKKLDWLNFRGSADLMACEIMMKIAHATIAIVPQDHARYVHSYGADKSRIYNRDMEYLKFMEKNPGIVLGTTPFDMQEFDELWNDVKIKVELVFIEEEN